MRFLVPTSGPHAAKETAAYIMQVATRIGADVIALHIDRKNESDVEAIGGPLVFTEAGKVAGVKTLPVTRSGNLVDEIIEAANEFSVHLIIMGASRGAVVSEWFRSDVKDRCEVPVLVVPHLFRDQSLENVDEK